MTNRLSTRLWRYQAERFPLVRTGALVAVFSASGVTLSSVLGGRALPGAGAYLCAFVVAFGLFFQLRAADEVKDADDDRRFRPERAIPRGLVSLRLVVSLAIAIAAFQAIAAYAYAPALLALLLLVWVWMALMSVEFFAPAFLRVRPVLYLASHMLVMPLIDLWITAVDWLPRGGVPPSGLVPALLLSFANGCVLEFGRKTWAPECERPGVETYSSLWGTRLAGRVWVGVVATAFALVVMTGSAASAGWAAGAPAAIALVLVVRAGRSFLVRPDRAAQQRLDAGAGFWVLASYAILGIVPATMRALR